MTDQFGLTEDIVPAQIPKEQDVFGLVNDIPSATPAKTWGELQTLISPHTTPEEQKRISNTVQISDVHKIPFDAAFDVEPQIMEKVNTVNRYLLNPAMTAWESIKQGAGGIVQSVGESMADKRSPAQQIADEFGFELPKDMPELRKSMTPEFMTRFGEHIATKGREITLRTQKNIESMSPKEDSPYIEKLGFMVIHNLGVNAPGLVAAIITKRPMAALGFLGGVSYGDKYAEERRLGATPDEAHIRALSVAGSEVGTEFIPISILLKPGLSIGKRIVQNLFSELVGENINTAYERMQSKAIHDPDKPFGDFVVQDLLPAFRDTTLVAGISSLAMSSAVHPFVNGIDKTSEEATKAVLDEIASTPEGEQEIKDSVEKFKEQAQNITGKAEVDLITEGIKPPLVGDEDITPPARMGVDLSEPTNLAEPPDLSEHLLAREKTDIVGDIKTVTDKVVGVISTRLKNIHPDIKYTLREYVFEKNKNIATDNTNAYDFVSKFSELDNKVKVELSEALLSGQKEKTDAIAAKYGLTKAVNQAKKIFETTREKAIKAGLEVGKTENYWPRSVKDVKGLLTEVRKVKEYSAIDEIFRKEAKKKGSPLQDEEKAVLINQMLRGVPNDRISLTSTSHLKERKFKEIPQQFLKYYAPADQSLLSYIKNMNKTIEVARLFGKKAKATLNPEIITENSLDKSIGEYVNELKEKGQLKGSDELPLRNMLQAIIRPAPTNRYISAYKSLTYLQLLTQWGPTITQIADIALSAEEAGYKNTTTALGKVIKKENIVTLKDLHIDVNKIIEEFEGGYGVIPELLKKSLEITGFTAVDRIGKETLVNAKLLEMTEQAKVNDSELINTLATILRDENRAIQVMQDLTEGNKTNDLLFVLWNELSDKQPISELEVPEPYHTSPVGKVFYSLKTYQLKLLDIYRNDVWHEIKQGDKRKGYKKLITLTTAIFLLGASTDEVKDFIFGRKTSFSDLVINNMLKIGGISKYTIYKTRTEGMSGGIISMIAPPFGIFDEGLRDIDELIRKGTLEKGASFTQDVPVVGKMYYWWLGRGSVIKEETQNSSQNKGFKH